MADLYSDITQSKDRITKLLNRNSEGWGDINDALSAVSSRKASFGEAMNAIKADRLKNEIGMQAALQREQQGAEALEERRLTREQTAADREAARLQSTDIARMRDETTRAVAEMRAAGTGGQPAAAIQNFRERQALVKQHGEKSPEVNRFDSYVRAQQQMNLGDRVSIIDPSNPEAPAAVHNKGVPPQNTPGHMGAVRTATESAESLQKKKDNMPKAQTALTQWERKVKTVTENVDKALDLARNSKTATGYGQFLAPLPETDARALNNYLDTIKANLGFDELQKMRDSSPTGGALGAVSEFENRLLQAVQAALDPKQSKQLIQNLETIKQLYPQVLEDRKKAFAADFKDIVPQAGASSGLPAGVTQEEFDAMTTEEKALFQ